MTSERDIADRKPRVDDATVGWIADGDKAEPKLATSIALDLRDARADLQRVMTKNAELRGQLRMAEAGLHQDGLAIEAQERELAELRAALATARRDAIEEAASSIQKKLQERQLGDLRKNDFGKGRDEGLADAEALVRALAPDTAEGDHE